MPSDHVRRFDEYQGIEELRSHSVEAHTKPVFLGVPLWSTWMDEPLKI
jgi:hypothetical protein